MELWNLYQTKEFSRSARRPMMGINLTASRTGTATILNSSTDFKVKSDRILAVDVYRNEFISQ